MAIKIKTKTPQRLLNELKKAIDAKEIDTWSYDSEDDFSHTPEQWKNKAWLRPKINENELVFGIVSRKDETMSKLIYGLYHGRFIEMMLTHFDTKFDSILATSLPEFPDVLK